MATCEHPKFAMGACRVETLGLKRIVTGPTREGVGAKVEELMQLGAVLVGDIECVDGRWTAVCDTSDPGC